MRWYVARCFFHCFVIFLGESLLVGLCGVLVRVEGGRCKFLGFFLIFVVLGDLIWYKIFPIGCLINVHSLV